LTIGQEAKSTGKTTKLRRLSPQTKNKMKIQPQHEFAEHWRWFGSLMSALLLLEATSPITAHTQKSEGFSSFTSPASVANNGALTAHFTAEYWAPTGGSFTCAGERIAKTGPRAFTKDSETCLISDLSTWPAGIYVLQPPSPTFPFTSYIVVNGVPFGWSSDFDGQVAVSGTFVVTDNGDETGTLNVEVYY
jgi:hypothetical protein